MKTLTRTISVAQALSLIDDATPLNREEARALGLEAPGAYMIEEEENGTPFTVLYTCFPLTKQVARMTLYAGVNDDALEWTPSHFAKSKGENAMRWR